MSEINFINEFNKYKINNITIEEHQNLLNMSGKLDILTTLNRKFIIYENLYFVYNKKEIEKLTFVIINNLIRHEDFTDFNNTIIKYIYDKYNTLKQTSDIINHTEFIVENIIIPKYYNELQQKTITTSQFNTKIIKQKKELKSKDIPVSKVLTKDTTTEKIKPTKKKSLPLVLKRNVWNKHIGEAIGKTLCLCCKLTEITQLNFSCGHIISEFNDGKLKLDNLKPICVSCNSSIGTKNMDDFIKEYGL